MVVLNQGLLNRWESDHCTLRRAANLVPPNSSLRLLHATERRSGVHSGVVRIVFGAERLAGLVYRFGGVGDSRDVLRIVFCMVRESHIQYPRVGEGADDT